MYNIVCNTNTTTNANEIKALTRVESERKMTGTNTRHQNKDKNYIADLRTKKVQDKIMKNTKQSEQKVRF